MSNWLTDRLRREQIERPQRADLVDAAGEPAAAQHQRGARGTAPAPGRTLHLDDVAHAPASLRRRDFRASAGFRRLERSHGPPRRPHHAARRRSSPPAAHAAGLAATQRVLAREMARSGALQRRLRGGSPPASRSTPTKRRRRAHARVGREALHLRRPRCCSYGAEGRLTTSVLADALPDETGTIAGDVVLRGGGDPTFGTAAAASLAAQIADAGLTRIEGRVIGDESAFDAFRGPPSSATASPARSARSPRSPSTTAAPASAARTSRPARRASPPRSSRRRSSSAA